MKLISASIWMALLFCVCPIAGFLGIKYGDEIFAQAVATRAQPPTTKAEIDTSEWVESYRPPKQSIHTPDGWISLEPLTVGYLDIGDGMVAVGYYKTGKFRDPEVKDGEKAKFFRWRDVAVNRDKLPKRQTTFSYMTTPVFPPGTFVVIDIDPPLEFVPQPDGNFGVGFYDFDIEQFYQIRGIRVDKKDVRAPNEEDAGPVLDLSKFQARPIISIDVPKYLADKLKEINLPAASMAASQPAPQPASAPAQSAPSQ